MKEYIASKRFFSGELNDYVEKNERIKFDGVRATFRGETRVAPQLMSAIRAKFLEAAKVGEDGKPIEQAADAEETPVQRAARMKRERLAQVRGVAGNGEFVEDAVFDAKRVAQHRKEQQLKTTADKTVAQDMTEDAAKTKGKKLEVVTETEGTEVGKIKTGAIDDSDKNQKTFYDALLNNERKKLPVDKDQFVPDKKRKLVVQDDENDAVEIKKLADSIGESAEIAISGSPLKAWNSLTVRKKETFLKKATDTSVIKKIIEQEKVASVKKKAEARLQELDEQGSASVV